MTEPTSQTTHSSSWYSTHTSLLSGLQKWCTFPSQDLRVPATQDTIQTTSTGSFHPRGSGSLSRSTPWPKGSPIPCNHPPPLPLVSIVRIAVRNYLSINLHACSLSAPSTRDITPGSKSPCLACSLLSPQAQEHGLTESACLINLCQMNERHECTKQCLLLWGTSRYRLGKEKKEEEKRRSMHSRVKHNSTSGAIQSIKQIRPLP